MFRTLRTGKGLFTAQRALWPLLAPLSSLYGLGMEVRARLYRSGILPVHRLPCPVISVGNLTMGGTGKTPTVIFLARLLRGQGRRPAVVSRGYGGSARGKSNVVSDGHSLFMGYQEAGDEPVLIAQSLPGTPVLTGRRRINPGDEAVRRFGADVVVLDDGFQHLSLERQFDCVLIDGRKGLGNGRLLPAGPLREHPRALARAHAIVITKCDDHDELQEQQLSFQQWNPTARIFHARYRPAALVDSRGKRIPTGKLRGTKICAVAALADPEYFLSMLRSQESEVVETCLFPDHYPYPDSIIPRIEKSARHSDCIITTEKDMIKLAGRMKSLFALAIEQEIMEHDAFQQVLLEHINAFEQS